MRQHNLFTLSLVSLAALGMIVPWQAVQAAGASTTTIQATNVELSADNTLTGYFVDAQQGAGKAGERVRLYDREAKVIAETSTCRNGRFEFQGVKAGIYLVEAADHLAPYRVWKHKTAPPRSPQHATLVSSKTNRAFCKKFQCMSPAHQVLCIVGIAAAIAVPIALLADDDDARQAASP